MAYSYKEESQVSLIKGKLYSNLLSYIKVYIKITEGYEWKFNEVLFSLKGFPDLLFTAPYMLPIDETSSTGLIIQVLHS